MGAGHNFEQLSSEIVKASVQDKWDDAKFEWELEWVEVVPGETCLCGHHPITYLCNIRNFHNKNLKVVGNVCVNRFLLLGSRKIFNAFKRVKKNIEKALNEGAIDLLLKREMITPEEHTFYLETWRKNRGLSSEQRARRVAINTRILKALEGKI